MKHSDSQDVHLGAYVGDIDPSLDPANGVGPGKLWVDTSATAPPWTLKMRNDSDAWDIVSGGGAGAGGDLVTLTFLLDGGGSDIAPGVKGDIIVDFAGTIEVLTVLSEATGSDILRLSIWRDTFANYPPTIADDIYLGGGGELAVTGTVPKLHNASPSLTHDTTINAGDILRINVIACTGVTYAALGIGIRRGSLMTLRVIQGFDYQGAFGAAARQDRFYPGGTNPGGGIALGAGRGSGGCLALTNVSGTNPDQCGYEIVLDASYHTITIGMAFKTDSYGGGDPIIFYLYDGATIQGGIEYSGDGSLNVYRSSNNGGSLLDVSAPDLVPLDTWIYLECEITIGTGTSGSWHVWVDGAQVINANRVSTQVSGNASANAIGLYSGNSGVMTKSYDDLYILTPDGILNTARLGDSRVRTLVPTATALMAGWVPHPTGAVEDDWMLIDETIDDDDATYLAATNADVDETVVESYWTDTIPVGDVTHGVSVVALARKTGAAAAPFSPCLRLNQHNDEPSDISPPTALTTSYAWYDGLFETDVSSGDEITTTDINEVFSGSGGGRGFQPGFKTRHPFGTNEVRVTRSVAQVLVAPGGGSGAAGSARPQVIVAG